MAKKITNTESTVNPITVNTLNINNIDDLTYEIGLGKLIKFVVDAKISEEELNAVFRKVCDVDYDQRISYLHEVWHDFNENLEFSHMCGDIEDCQRRVQKDNSVGIIKRTWNKIKSWFKK